MSDDIAALVRDLTNAPPTANRNVRRAIQYTAQEIRDDWRQGAARSGLGNYARSIDYDIRYPLAAIEAEIGPNLAKRQGTFGFVEDGGGGVHSAPQHAGRDALEANEPDFERGLQIAIYDAVVGGRI